MTMSAERARRFTTGLDFEIEPDDKAFCPTGPGGGVDPTCSPHSDGGGRKNNALVSLTAKVDRALQDAHLPGAIRASYKKSMTKALKKLSPKAREVLDNTVKSINFYTNHREMCEGIADHLLANRGAPAMSRTQIADALTRDGTVAMTIEGEHLFLDGSMSGQLTGPHADQSEMAAYLHEIGHVLDRGINGESPAWGSDSPYWQQAWENEIQGGQITTIAASRKLEGWAEFNRVAYSNPRAARREFPQSWAVLKQHGLVK